MEEQQKMKQPNGIYAAMAAIVSEIGAIGKDKRCSQGASFAYRGIDDVYNALNPIMAKHGVFVLPVAGERTTETRQSRNGAAMEIVVMRMTYKFCHADGSSVEAVTVGQAMDSGDKATNKAMAIAHKYAILQAFCIPTEDMEDPDAVAEQLGPCAPQKRRPQTQEQRQVAQQREAAKANNPDPLTDKQQKAICAHLTRLYGNDRDACLNELSNFFGCSITSTNALTKAQASNYLDAINHSQQEA